jgi:hypothetical protein
LADGDHCFFEVNPAGQFLYLDLIAGTQICKLVAEALQGETPTEYPIPFVSEHLKDREAAKRVVLEQLFR